WSRPDADDALEPGSGLATASRYDALGRPVKVTDPTGKQVTVTYGRSGGPTSVVVDGRTYVAFIAHNARGQRLLIGYGNGLMTRYAYDPDTFRLVRIRTEPATVTGDTWTANGTALQDLTYSYDLVGNVTGAVERTPGCGVAGTALGRDALSRVFTYDARY